jgi:D-amino peptidase
MTQEANAAIRGAFDGGATSVTVADSHGSMSNMLPDELDPRARLVSGLLRPFSMVEGVTDDMDGLVLIGYHAAAGNFGNLAHTYSGAAFHKITVNGELLGEPTLFAGYAASIGVPLLAVSGDQYLAEEIKSQFPHAKSIIVKQTISSAASNGLSPKHARELIENEVAAAVSKAKNATVDLPIKPPFVTEVQFHKQAMADAVCFMPHVERVDSVLVRFEVDNFRDLIGTVVAMSLIVAGVMS